jgi:hypothetical protein
MIVDTLSVKLPSPTPALQPASADEAASPGSQPLSTRSVRWMSPTKLNRKRTLDRINQRASR